MTRRIPPPKPPSPTLHLPASPPNAVQRFSGHFALALENRLDLMTDVATPTDVVALVLSALDEARKEMGWA